MSRRVQTGAAPMRGAPGPSQVPKQENADDYLSRLLKYIPAEIVGLYLAVRGIVPVAATDVLWYVAVASWILVPLYFWKVTTIDDKRPLIIQIVLATIAFPIWVFAIGGQPVESLHGYPGHEYLASIILIFATVLFGWIAPQPGS